MSKKRLIYYENMSGKYICISHLYTDFGGNYVEFVHGHRDHHNVLTRDKIRIIRTNKFIIKFIRRILGK